MKFNPDTQKLIDIEDTGGEYWLRIFLKGGDVVEGCPDCLTYVTIGDDEDVDAMSFNLRDGTGLDIAGMQIDHFEILEKRRI